MASTLPDQPELLTVVETLEFIRVAADIFDDVERMRLIAYLAARPASGVVIPGAGGVRKLRWGLEGRGKRGGARVIYYFADWSMPVFLLSA